MRSYRGDPYWIVAQRAGVCPCGQPVATGQRTFYYPKTRTVHCPPCSDRAAADFQAAAEDEHMMSGGY